MRFDYCPKCGTKAVLREIGDEGEMPFCESCQAPLFDLFPVCVLCVAADEQGEIALIRQSYVNNGTYVGVAGYMKSGESGEEAALREVAEELGLQPCEVIPIKTYPYVKKDMLMLGYLVRVKRSEFSLSDEVDSAAWFRPEDAVKAVREGSIIGQLIMDCLGYILK